MTAKKDETPDADDESKTSGTVDPGGAGEPDAGPPKPLDDMPVPPLTEPADTSGG